MTFTLTTTSTNNITLAAFRSPFTFSDILTPARHLGDSGSSTGPIAGTKILTFQTIVPANTSIALVVNAVDSGVGVGTPYTLDVTSTVGGSPCGTGIDIKVYTGAAVPIPDNVPTGVDVTLPVSGIGRIRDMNFRFIAPNVAACNATPGNVNAAVDHTFVGDLRFKLTSPKGTAVTFMANRGGARDNICNTTIIDKFGNPLLSTITNTSGQFISGFFQPEDTGRLSNFTGENADGIWTLNVSDTAGNDTGNLRRFALQFNFNIFSFNDFDNDGTSDLAISRVNGANREWWYRKSNSGGAVAALVFGSPNDKITPADFTGDGRTDVAFWRPSNGNWFILRSEDFTFYAFPLGSAGDIPVPADYDGDGKTDAAVFRPVGALWYVNKSAGGTLIQSFGLSTYAPVPADYDGDNKADLAIFRQNGANKEWWYQKSSNNTVFAAVFGTTGDKAVQADYTGDGKVDIAVWRPSIREWFVLRSEDLSYFGFHYGSTDDIPVPGDYDGDGKYDAAVFRPSTGTWYLNRSTSGNEILGFGTNGDTPTASAYIP